MKQKTIADYDYPMKHIVIKKGNKSYKELVKIYGGKLLEKLAKANVTLDAFIGAIPKTCEQLKGLGSTLQKLSINGQRLDFGLTEYSNHVWLPQVVKEDGDYRTISLCFNCGSIMDKGKLIDNAQEKEVEKEEK